MEASDSCKIPVLKHESQINEQQESFSRHAREGGHPAFLAEHFWIHAAACPCEGRGGNDKL
jgi:hypothetical protein